MITKRAIILFLSAAVFGCSNIPIYTISENYSSLAPNTVVVLPVWGDVEDANVRRLFRTMALARLNSLNYSVLALEEVDEKYLKLGSGRFKDMNPGEVSRFFGADAVLYTRITKWEEKLLVTYASLEIGAGFELYSADGTMLWKAHYSTSEYDIKFDKSSMELAVIMVYEPRIQRVVDAVFSTLPSGLKPKEEKRFFDWLPQAGS
jgi:hypothetical protein